MKYLFPLYVLLLLSCQSSREKSTTTVIADSLPVTGHSSQPPSSPAKKIAFNTTPFKAAYDSVKVDLPGGRQFYLSLLRGYQLKVAASGLGRLRFLALSPDNRLFATDMYDRSDNLRGRVLVFDNWDEQTKTFRDVRTYLSGLHNPNQVAFQAGYIYVAETNQIRRYSYQPGDRQPSDTGQRIASFPDYGLSYKYGGWHLTRSMAFHNNKLYVSVGSSCNACIEKEAVRASVLEMNLDGTGSRTFASGLRNSVGLKWIGDELWATGMGRDLIGPDKPEDVFQEIEEGKYYGWPFYYQYKGRIYADEQFKDSARSAIVQPPPVAYAGFLAHSAPLGFEYFTSFSDPRLNNSVLVCLHGSTSVWRERGNSIVRIEAGNRYTDIIKGFLKGKTEAGRMGRPCDILKKDARSFFFTDDLNGVLYFVERS